MFTERHIPRILLIEFPNFLDADVVDDLYQSVKKELIGDYYVLKKIKKNNEDDKEINYTFLN